MEERGGHRGRMLMRSEDSVESAEVIVEERGCYRGRMPMSSEISVEQVRA